MNVLGLLFALVYIGIAVLFIWAAIVVIIVGTRWLKKNPSRDYGAPHSTDEL